MSTRSLLGLFALLLALSIPGRADVNPKTCVPRPAVTDFAYGDLVSCNIDVIGTSNLFRFSGRAGDVVNAKLLRLTTNADQCLRLIDPDGVIGSLSCVGAFVSTRFATLEYAMTLTKTGSYTVQVSDGSNDEVFSYAMVLYRVFPTPQPATTLAFGVPAKGQISPRGDMDFYTFTGTAGDSLSLTVSRTSDNADHCAWLIGPDGKDVTAPACAGAFVSTRFVGLSFDQKLRLTGTYYLAIYDGSFDETFSYNIELQCFGTCISGPPPPPPGNCSYSLAPPAQVVPAGASSGTIGVLTSTACPWTASTSATHISITSGFSGTGPGTVQYSVTANSGQASRTGTLIAGGQTATITQSGGAPLLLITPNTVAVQWRQGSPAPPNLVISVFTNTASLNYTAAVTAGSNWLSLAKTSGTAPGNLSATVNPSALAAGTYQGTITVTAPTANPTTQTLSVTLTVDAAGSPKLSVNSSPLTYSFAQGAQQIRRERIPVGNSGGGSLTFKTTASTSAGGDWLSVPQDSPAATLSASSPVTVTIDPSGLAGGTFTGHVTITSDDSTQDIPVTVTISAVRQTILLSQSGLTFTAVAKGGTVPPQSFGVLNTGQAQMDWSLTAATLSGGNWLTATPNSGTTDANSLTVPLVNVSVNAANLDPGQYSGQIEVRAATADNTPQTVSVILNVLPPGSDPGPIVRPTGLIFTEASGGAPAAPQTITISNLTAIQRTFTTGRLTTDGANWFTVTPASGTVTPSQPANVTVSVSSTGLAPGIRRGVLTLLFQDGSVQTVNILYLLLAATGPNSSLVRALATGTCTPAKLLPLVTSLGAQFGVPAGWPNALEAQVVDDCGNPHVAGSVTATFSNGDPPLPLVSLKNGKWAGTWQVRSAKVPLIVITTTADNPDLGISGSVTLTGGVQATQNPPVIGAGGVLSAASYATYSPLAPGGMVSIFGSNLSNGTAASPKLPLETQLAGTVVTMGGRVAPLIAASDGQVNAIVPFGLPVNTRHQVVVKRGNAYTTPESVTLAAAQPAFFTKSQDGKGQAIVVRPDGNYAEKGTPASPGDTVIFYCAGLGEVSPKATEGLAVPYPPFYTVVADVSMTIGGQPANVSFAGLVPGLTSLYQINAVVPAGVQGDALPVVIKVAGQSSPPATMAVK